MNPARPMLDCNFALQQEVQPSALLANRFQHLHEICQGSMIRADDDGPSQQMLPVLLQAIRYSEQFLASNAIVLLCMRQGSA